MNNHKDKITLTKQWKNKKLKAGSYYITTTFTDEVLKEWFDGDEFRTVYTCEVKEILASVPDYEEWISTKDNLNDYKKLCYMRGTIINKMEESNSNVEKLLRQENQQLKELLKECKSSVLFEADVMKETSGKQSNGYKMLTNILSKIDEVLK